MKITRFPYPYAFALLLVPSLAEATKPDYPHWAHERVQQGLVTPLTQQQAKNSKFSRGRQPPRERRVRLPQTTVTRDKSGNAFLPFAVDVRYGESEWQNDDVTGCVYQGSGKLFVKVGDEYRPAAFLLGKNLDPVAGVCETVAPES